MIIHWRKLFFFLWELLTLEITFELSCQERDPIYLNQYRTWTCLESHWVDVMLVLLHLEDTVLLLLSIPTSSYNFSVFSSAQFLVPWGEGIWWRHPIWDLTKCYKALCILSYCGSVLVPICCKRKQSWLLDLLKLWSGHIYSAIWVSVQSLIFLIPNLILNTDKIQTWQKMQKVFRPKHEANQHKFLK